ncbi:phage portal protein [Singulisphaera sp. PoT]|uniref:phage portal protein n=1 Tax=Singulisphaera sp. PoT TaxID=3411797 RepID=UPI003BF47ADF
MYKFLAAIEDGLGRAAPTGVGMGAMGGYSGGPAWLDVNHTKRPPLSLELIDAYKSVAYACIRLNSTGGARVPLRLFVKTGPKDRRPRRAVRSISRSMERRLRFDPGLEYVSRNLGADDTVEEVMEHQLLETLNRPNPYFSGHLFKLFLFVSLDVIGMTYIYPTRVDPSYAATELWPLQSQYVLPIKGTGANVIDGYSYFTDRYRFDELVRIRDLSLRDPYTSGYPPLHACFEQVGLGDYYVASCESILKNGAKPAAILSPKDPIFKPGEPERRRLETDINHQFARAGQGRIWVTDGQFELSSLNGSPIDLGTLEITKNMRLQIANCFDVPISLLQSEDSNRAVASEGTHQHQYYAIEPRCCLIGEDLTHSLAAPVNPRMFFAFDNAVIRDEEKRATIFDMKLKNGSMVINDVLAEDGLDPVPWGYEPWLPSTLTQPSIAAQQREQAQANAEAAAKQLGQAKPGQQDDDQEDDEDDDEGEAKRSLYSRLGRVLEQLERSAGAGDRGGDPWAHYPAVPAVGRRDEPARGQHVRASGWGADAADPAGVVPASGQGDPGVDPAGGADPGEAAGPVDVRRSDDGSDDPAFVTLLGRGGEDDPGEPGAGSGRVEGDGPEHEEGDQ